MILYFAYGSLMDLHFIQELGVTLSNPKSAVIKGFEFETSVKNELNPSYGYANIRLNKHEEVEGILLEINEHDLSILDEYEGYPELYSREKLSINITHSNELVLAWVYLGSLNYTVSKNLLLSDIQKDRIKKGFPFLSKRYQRKLSKFLI